MTTHIIATAILALTFGALWHNQPARRYKHDRELRNAGFAQLTIGAWKWLQHLSVAIQRKRRVVPTGTPFKPKMQPELLPRARALLAWDPWHQIVANRTAAGLAKPSELLPSKSTTPNLATGHTA